MRGFSESGVNDIMRAGVNQSRMTDFCQKGCWKKSSQNDQKKIQDLGEINGNITTHPLFRVFVSLSILAAAGKCLCSYSSLKRELLCFFGCLRWFPATTFQEASP